MLPLVPLIVALFGPTIHVLPTPARESCPTAPLAVYATPARTCPALEISGRIDATGALLDPVFDEDVAPTQLARLGRGDAVLTGFSADGKTLFVLPFVASGAFHLDVPIAPSSAAALQRLRLVTAAGAVERTAASHVEPGAEAVSVDDQHFVFAWDAHLFPAIRLAMAPGTAPIAYGAGNSTYEQLNIASSARRVSVEFSDGLHSVTRTIQVFGR